MSSKYPNMLMEIVMNCGSGTPNTNPPAMRFIQGGIVLNVGLNMNFK